MRQPEAGERLTFTEESERVPEATVTLVRGSTFAILDRSGDIRPGSVCGLFVGDTRVCSTLSLTIDGHPLESLTASDGSATEAMFVSRTIDRELLVLRNVAVDRGMSSTVTVRNLSSTARTVEVRCSFGTDLADVFAVKEGRAVSRSHPCRSEPGRATFGDDAGDRGLVVRWPTAHSCSDDGSVTWEVELGPRGEWVVTLDFAAIRGGDEVRPAESGGVAADDDEALRRWSDSLPTIDTDIDGLEATYRRSCADIGGLRLFDPGHDDPVIAAGAPWFMTLFGRDSILTSWMPMWIDPNLALATATTLARLQGTRDDPDTEEQPGRILHEVRFSKGSSLDLDHGEIYYGTADATPLFVMLVGELWRWGTPLEQLTPLMGAVDAALGWIDGPGDLDGDGFVEYRRRSASSLVNQGWKDSFDGVSFADGSLPDAPIALAEVQAYSYGAWRAGARLAAAMGDTSLAEERDRRAEALRYRFERDFWLADRGAFAIALDADKRPVDAIASNMGHCLWTGIVSDRDKIAAVAGWLASPEFFTGWGVRTLARSMGRYNPLSYHNGSVWPHDTAICIAGLSRVGHHREASIIAAGLLDAASAVGGRLPELFSGLDRAEVPVPVDYPASCSPQAWASAAPLFVIRSLLGIEPDLPDGTFVIDPRLPDGSKRLRLDGMWVGGRRVGVHVEPGRALVSGLPVGVTVRHGETGLAHR